MKNYTTLENLKILSGSHKASMQQTDEPGSIGKGTWGY